MSIAVVVILSSAGTSMDSVASSIIVCAARIVPGPIAGRTCEGIAVTLGREVVPIRVVRHRADMALNVGAIAAGVATDCRRVVIHSAWNAVGNTRYTIAH